MQARNVRGPMGTRLRGGTQTQSHEPPVAAVSGSPHSPRRGKPNGTGVHAGQRCAGNRVGAKQRREVTQMSKKILTVLAPVAALIAFAMVPAMAQATTLQAPHGTALPNGSSIVGQSSTLKTTTTKQPSEEAGATLECSSSVFEGEVTSTGGADVTGIVSSSHNQGCTAGGLLTDVTTNASVAAPWTVQIQQPEAEHHGILHIEPASGSSIQFQAPYPILRVHGRTVRLLDEYGTR